MKHVIIYTTPFCGYCRQAKDLLKELGIEYEEVDVAANADLFRSLIEKYSWQSVPMIVIGDQFIGGYNDLVKLHKSGKLLPMLASESQE